MRFISRGLVAALIGGIALGVPVFAGAAPEAWRAGTPMYIEESDASDLLEQTYDSAYCQGIPRFGHRGEFPYEEFKVFDCSVHMRSYDCFDNRYKAIKHSRQGWFQLRRIARGDCY